MPVAEAISVIDAHTNAIQHQILPNLNTLQARTQFIVDTSAEEWAKFDTRLTVNEGAVEVNDRHIKETYAAFLAHRDLSFWQRLRWLFLGSGYR